MGISFMSSPGKPVEYFGYTDEKKNAMALLLDENASVCMATEVRDFDIADLANHGVIAKGGDWVVSRDAEGGETQISGPFPSMEAAFAFGQENYGVVRWLSGLQSNF